MKRLLLYTEAFCRAVSHAVMSLGDDVRCEYERLLEEEGLV